MSGKRSMGRKKAFFTLDPGFGVSFFRIPVIASRISDPGFRIPDPKPIFLNLWGKSTMILSVLTTKCSLPVQNKIIYN
jgi:hypothetical protein